jgi:dienelactone hydrolase
MFTSLKALLVLISLIVIIVLGIIIITIIRVLKGVPDPTGIESIGRTQQIWVDENRNEILSTNRKREIVTEIWYPAQQGTGTTMPYVSEKLEKHKSLSKLNNFYFKLASHINHHALAQAQLSDHTESYPVILLSPSQATNVELYTSFAEELASNGYIVIGINHPYDVIRVILSDGTIADNIEDLDYTSRTNVRTEDILFVLDHLIELNTNNEILADRLDLTRIGVMGHSLGGLAASQACSSDQRLKACINIDGIHDGDPFSVQENATVPSQPFLFVGKERSFTNKFTEIQENNKNFSTVMIKDVGHEDFMDAYLFIVPLSDFFSPPARRAVLETRHEALKFFQVNL